MGIVRYVKSIATIVLLQGVLHVVRAISSMLASANARLLVWPIPQLTLTASIAPC